jgi:rod shape-determining protein MreD
VSYYIGIPLLLLLALLEASVLPLFRVAGLQPNLLLVLLVVWLMVRGSGEAFVLIPIGGVFMGLVDGAPMGTALLALAPIAFLQEIRGAHLSESGLVLTIAFVVFMTAAYHTVYFAIFALQGQSGPIAEALLGIVLPVGFLNVLVAIPAYVVMSAFSQELRRPSYA